MCIFYSGDISADDEIIESLVRSASSKRRPVTRERRRNRISDKKNCKYLTNLFNNIQSYSYLFNIICLLVISAKFDCCPANLINIVI